MLLLTTVYGAWPGAATAASGLDPDKQVVEAVADASGYVVSPAVVALRFRSDPGESAVAVWVSSGAGYGAAGEPVRGAVGSCRSAEIRPLEGGLLECPLPTTLLRAGVTYHWWVVSDATDETGSPVRRVTASATFRAGAATPWAEQSAIRRVTLELAASLPRRDRYAGTGSSRNVVVEALIRHSLSSLAAPRKLAAACWTDVEFADLLASVGQAVSAQTYDVLGIWLGAQPRWLHLSGDACARIQRLIDTRRIDGADAYGLVVALHEALHAYGFASEAQANCYAVQLVPAAARFLGYTPGAAARLGRSALTYTRESSPRGYWSGSKCRAGGGWDLPGGPFPRDA